MEQNENNNKENKNRNRIIGSLIVFVLCAIPKIAFDVYRDRQAEAKDAEIRESVVEYVTEKSNLTNERFYDDVESYITENYYEKASINRFKNIGEEVGYLQKTVECQVDFLIEDTLITGMFYLTYTNIEGTFDYELSDCSVNLLSDSVITPGAEDYIFSKRPLNLGQIEGTTYRNEYAGFACDLDENWIIASDESLQKLAESSEGMFDSTMLGEVNTNYEQFYDLQAENVDEMTTINVLYTKQPILNYLNFLALDEEDIVDAAIHYNQGMLEEVLSQGGISIFSIEKEKVMFLGEERYALRTVGKLYDIPMYSIQLMEYHSGQYSVTLTLTSYYTDNLESMLEMFYKIDN